MSTRKRAPRNRTLTLSSEETVRLRDVLQGQETTSGKLSKDRVLRGHYKDHISSIAERSVDLLFLDPPYNLTKSFNGKKFVKKRISVYTEWLDEILALLKPLLKRSASIYICGDWHTSHSIYEVAARHFIVRNRITWEREKGRGAKTNWKNAHEDIWFCTVSGDYYFNVDAVKLRRRVLAPYKDGDGKPKDWSYSDKGNFRDTHPSNSWTDISIPFWSMSENTDHPTQKSEKLMAKLLLASSRPGDTLLDPFLGSGTSAVVAKKLDRRYIGVEVNEEYCLLALKRLELASEDKSIQGYEDGVFWERNSHCKSSKRAR
jgi:site-specific DNA-methyltransferase (adenine-specific)